MSGAAESRFPEVMLGVSVALWAGFGLWLLLDPATLSNAEIDVETPTARAEVRAFYGGLELGVAAFLAWCLRDGSVRVGLVAALTVLLGVAVCRTAGVALEGFGVKPLIYALGASEWAGVAATWAATRTVAKRGA